MGIKINDTACDYPKKSCIHEQFQKQVLIRPNQPAVLFPSICDSSIQTRELTYCELDRRADLLHSKMMESGVRKNSIVALYMDRSIEMVVALVGILKAGCAYLPLDPAYPMDRLVFMLNDTNAPLIITQSHLRSNLPLSNTPILIMDHDWGSDISTNEVPSPVIQGPESLAYINYTSGSTGRPKGVKVPHRGVLRLVFGANYTVLDDKQTILQLAPISFDAATFEIWGALLLGGKCVLFPYNGIPDPKDLKNVIDKYGVTRIWLTASLFNLIIDIMPESLANASEILTGGEALSVPHIRKALELIPECQLVNGYGPTESTTFTCCYRIPKVLKEGINSIPIGRPISNTQVYILDSSMNPVGESEDGELYIGGDGLADGYLNLPEMTTERFVSDPFHPGERLYKTGDLVRLLPEGEIEFIGRFDDQVKINGFRIELGEIEVALRNYQGVKDALVIAEKDENGTKFLLGFVTSNTGMALNINDLKQHLTKHVAQFMVPRDLCLLDAIPINPNGKADRQLILKEWKEREIDDPDYAPPVTETEKKLCRIWMDVLNKVKISIGSNFFDIGGTSILSVKLMKKVSDAFGKDIPVLRLYNYSTIKSLAKFISEGEEGGGLVSKTQDRAKLQRESMSRRKEANRRIRF